MSVVTSNSRTSDQHGQSCMPCLSERYKSERRAFLVSKVTQNLQQCLQVHAVECFLAVPEVDIDLLRLKQLACSGALNPRPFSSSQEGSCYGPRLSGTDRSIIPRYLMQSLKSLFFGSLIRMPSFYYFIMFHRCCVR